MCTKVCVRALREEVNFRKEIKKETVEIILKKEIELKEKEKEEAEKNTEQDKSKEENKNDEDNTQIITSNEANRKKDQIEEGKEQQTCIISDVKGQLETTSQEEQEQEETDEYDSTNCAGIFHKTHFFYL